MKTYDFLVLGGGSAGFNAARVAVSVSYCGANGPDPYQFRATSWVI